MIRPASAPPAHAGISRHGHPVERSGRLVLLIAALVLILAGGRDTFAQPGSPSDVQWHFRYELFQMLLEERGLAVADSLEMALVTPKDSVVVLLGNWTRQDVDPGKLLPFIAKGGRLLLASDRAARMGASVSFVAGPITSGDESTQYQQLPDCLRVTDLDDSHPLMQGVHEIVVNRSGWLSLPPESTLNWQAIATVPKTCRPQRCRSQPLIAVSQDSRPGAGSMIVAADPSLFTNSMMWHGDNAVLAIRTSEELCRGGKKRLAFIVDGTLLPSDRQSHLLQEATPPAPTTPAPPQSGPPMPPPKLTWEQRLRLANTVIQNVEQSGILNEALINNPRYPNQRLYPRVILLILAVITAVWLLSKLRQSASVRPGEPSPRAMKTAKRMASDAAGTGRDYASIAQTLARELCRELTGSSAPREWERSLTDAELLPTLTSLTSSQRRDLEEIVELAVDRSESPIYAHRLERIGSMIQQLRSIHRRSTKTAATTSSLLSSGYPAS